MRPLTFGSCFAGIGGFDLGLESAGFRCAWQVEINPWSRKVLAKHWPDVPKHPDIRDVGAHNLAHVDLVCGGFPCQDLSVAGKRAGLTGARSGLFYELMRVVRELEPDWVLFENVPGLLSSSGGRDFYAVLQEMADGGFRRAYRILDSQYFGVAQRRRRVFLVGCARATGGDPGAVLVEPTGVRGDSAAGEEAGRRLAATLRGRAASRGVNVPGRGGEDDSNLVVGSLKSTEGGMDCEQAAAGHVVASNWQQGGATALGLGLSGVPPLRVGQTLATVAGPMPALSDRNRGQCDFFTSGGLVPTVAGTLNANTSGGRRTTDLDGHGAYVVTPVFASGAEGANGAGIGLPGDPMFTLDTTRAGTLRAGSGSITGGVPFIAHSLSAEGCDASEDGTGRGVPLTVTHALAVQHGATEDGTGRGTPLVAVALVSRDSKGPDSDTKPGHLIENASGVRRLTPTCCERLQGFPDGHTCLCGVQPYTTASCICPDTPRYAGLGNAVTVNVIAWIGRRLAEQIRLAREATA